MQVFAGLGGNVGDRLAMLKAAVEAMQSDPEIEVVRTSSVYETSPVGPEQPDFLNAVVELDTDLAAAELLARFQAIEVRLGRIRRPRWGPREIDIDLLFYGEETIDEEGITVPHPELGNRAFVLVPLSELAPSLVTTIDRQGVRLAYPPDRLL